MTNSATLPATNPTTARKETNTSRLPSLDGWRAFSILLVLGDHSRYTDNFPAMLAPFLRWVTDGDLGVRFFFAISGFLITWLLLREREKTGSVDLKRFYVRRSLRILPVYIAFLLALTALTFFTDFHQKKLAWISNATFTTNFVTAPFTSHHLWSLAVEEQFYILWPGLFAYLASRNKKRGMWIALILPIVVAPVFRWISFARVFPPVLGPLFTTWSFFRYFDTLAIGCAGAVLLSNHKAFLEGKLSGKTFPFLLAATLVLVPFVLAKLYLCHGLITVLGHTVQGLGIAMLILQSVIWPSRKCYQALNWKWVCHLGVLSYSIYIWQQIFCTNSQELGIASAWWLRFPGWLVPAFVVALASYYLLERPFLALRTKFRAPVDVTLTGRE